jgi:hypothetical protein
MRMKIRSKMTVVFLGSWLILLSASVFAQSTQAVAGGDYSDSEGVLGVVCQFSGVTEAGCSAPWNFNGSEESGSVVISGTAKYGQLTGKVKSKIKITEAYMPPVTTISGVNNDFFDVLSFPTLPNGTEATLSVTAQLTGISSVSNVSSSAPVWVYAYIGPDGYAYSECTLSAGGTTCTTTWPWGGGQGSLGFGLIIRVSAFATPLAATGTASASGDYDTKITALTMMDADGNSYEIVAASGHKYPK